MLRLANQYLDYLKAAKGLISILRDPDRTESVFVITEALQDSEAFRRMLEQVRRDPEGARLVEDHYLAPLPDLDQLARLPEGSLGQSFASSMRKKGLKIDFYPSIRIKDDATYLAMRLRMTHDVWHVITGFDTTPQGEIGLQAFMLAQLLSPLSAALIGGALLRSLFGGVPEHMTLHALMDSVVTGWRMGRSARPLIGQRWEEGWARPLPEWQRSLNVTPLDQAS
jgi:ubiquinone biosynthesis protein COQ4